MLPVSETAGIFASFLSSVFVCFVSKDKSVSITLFRYPLNEDEVSGSFPTSTFCLTAGWDCKASKLGFEPPGTGSPPPNRCPLPQPSRIFFSLPDPRTRMSFELFKIIFKRPPAPPTIFRFCFTSTFQAPIIRLQIFAHFLTRLF